MKLHGVSQGNYNHYITSGPFKNYNHSKYGSYAVHKYLFKSFLRQTYLFQEADVKPLSFLGELDKKVYCRSTS